MLKFYVPSWSFFPICVRELVGPSARASLLDGTSRCLFVHEVAAAHELAGTFKMLVLDKSHHMFLTNAMAGLGTCTSVDVST